MFQRKDKKTITWCGAAGNRRILCRAVKKYMGLNLEATSAKSRDIARVITSMGNGLEKASVCTQSKIRRGKGRRALDSRISVNLWSEIKLCDLCVLIFATSA